MICWFEYVVITAKRALPQIVTDDRNELGSAFILRFDKVSTAQEIDLQQRKKVRGYAHAWDSFGLVVGGRVEVVRFVSSDVFKTLGACTSIL